MAIAFIGSNEQASTTNAGSYSLTPFTGITGLASGQVALIAVTCGSNTSGSVTFTGWTSIRVNGTAHRASVWYRVLDGTETTTTAYTFDPPGTCVGVAMVSAVYSGVDTVTPIAADAAYATGGTADAVTSNTVNNPSANNWRVFCFQSAVTNDATITWSSSSGGIERNQIQSGDSIDNSTCSFWDSNGTFATGNTTVTGTSDSALDTDDARCWLGFLQASVTDVNAPAESAAVTVTAYDAKIAFGIPIDSLAVTVTAYDAVAALGAVTGSPVVTVTAQTPVLTIEFADAETGAVEDTEALGIQTDGTLAPALDEVVDILFADGAYDTSVAAEDGTIDAEFTDDDPAVALEGAAANATLTDNDPVSRLETSALTIIIPTATDIATAMETILYPLGVITGDSVAAVEDVTSNIESAVKEDTDTVTATDNAQNSVSANDAVHLVSRFS